MKKNAAWIVLLLAWPGLIHAESKSLDRTHDPVVMECRELGKLLGTPVENLSLLSRRDGKWIAVPFQIDQNEKRSVQVRSRNHDMHAPWEAVRNGCG